MLGKSSRFFDKGYNIPKYQLPLGKRTVFFESLKSFHKYFEKEKFIFVVRDEFNSKIFVEKEVVKLGILNYKIVESNKDTRGQAETVLIALQACIPDEPIIIFNIDTIRHNFTWPKPSEFGDGFLEVFHAKGSNWSFIEAGENFKVIRTSEKNRISDLCSNGIYGFAKAEYFIDAYNKFLSNIDPFTEIYIAPLFNSMIESKLIVKYRVAERFEIEHCGDPLDYENLKKRLEHGETL